MGGMAFIPGVGWIVGAAYFLADPVVKAATGKSIGDNVGSGVSKATGFVSSIWNSTVSGFSNLEYQLKNGWRPY